jgi:hypothetical protein
MKKKKKAKKVAKRTPRKLTLLLPCTADVASFARRFGFSTQQGVSGEYVVVPRGSTAAGVARGIREAMERERRDAARIAAREAAKRVALRDHFDEKWNQVEESASAIAASLRANGSSVIDEFVRVFNRDIRRGPLGDGRIKQDPRVEQALPPAWLSAPSPYTREVGQ